MRASFGFFSMTEPVEPTDDDSVEKDEDSVTDTDGETGTAH